MKKKIIVGLDFDGVVAYNPARLARLPISFVKRHVFGIQKLGFFVPKNPMERTLWALAHETSIIPANGISKLRTLARGGIIEAHLVTARFGFLEGHLMRFLKRWDLMDVFSTVTLNRKEEQPHLFKERMIRKKGFQYFVEDNWDIVNHLNHGKSPTEIHWIYNILDRRRDYPYKYPYLSRSLERITSKAK